MSGVSVCFGTTGEDNIAAPPHTVSAGYRHVTLKKLNGQVLRGSTLFVHISIDTGLSCGRKSVSYLTDPSHVPCFPCVTTMRQTVHAYLRRTQISLYRARFHTLHGSRDAERGMARGTHLAPGTKSVSEKALLAKPIGFPAVCPSSAVLAFGIPLPCVGSSHVHTLTIVLASRVLILTAG